MLVYVFYLEFKNKIFVKYNEIDFKILKGSQELLAIPSASELGFQQFYPSSGSEFIFSVGLRPRLGGEIPSLCLNSAPVCLLRPLFSQA